MNNGIFEGGFRRLPEQNLAGASKHTKKYDFLQKIHLDRVNRQLDVKKNKCATVIQAAVRGFLCRIKINRNLETLLFSAYYANDKSALNYNELGKLVYTFYRLNNFEYNQILLWLTKQFILNKLDIIKNYVVPNSLWVWRVRWFLSIHITILKQLSNISLSGDIYNSLQLLDEFTDYNLISSVIGPVKATYSLKEIFVYIVNGYFYVSKMILNNCNLNNVNESESKCRNRLSVDFVLQMINRPIMIITNEDSTYRSKIVIGLCQTYLTNQTTSTIESVIFPTILSNDSYFISTLADVIIDGSIEPTTSCFYILVKFFKKGCENYFSKLMQALAVLLSVWQVDFPKSHLDNFLCDESCFERENDEDDDDDVSFKSAETYSLVFDLNVNMKKESFVYLKSIEFSIDALNYLNSDYCDEVIINFSKFIHILVSKHSYLEYKILWYASLLPSFYQDLWRLLSSMHRITFEGKSISLITLLSRGSFLSFEEARDFYPLLISFCLVFKRYICMLHTDEITETGNPGVMSFSISTIIEITSRLKDIAVALLNIGLPETTLTISSHLRNCNISPMYESYKAIINLLRVLHSREIGGTDQSYWISKKIFMPQMLPIFDESYLIDSFFSKHRLFEEATMTHGPTVVTNNSVKPFIVLRDLPFCVPTKNRLNKLQHIFLAYKSRYQNSNEAHHEQPFIKIRRAYIYEDAFDKFSTNEVSEIKINLRIQLISSMGYEEVGVDGGGIFREFMSELLKTAFDPNRGFFLLNKDRQLYPNPNVAALYSNFRSHYFFIGRMLAKALYENILVELPLAECFISSLIHKDKDVNLYDLHSLDPELFKNLISLRSYEGDFSNLGLNYTIVSDLYGQTKVIELIDDGEKISVNRANKIDYIQTVADYKLNTQFHEQISHFKQGISSVFSLCWLSIFSAKELQKLLFCSDCPIDVEDLKNNCIYTGGYSRSHPNIIRFWNVFDTFGDKERKQLLQFVTSCARQPLLGFKDLDPPFTIQLVESSDRLPTSSTCMNLLKLPIFKDENIMKEKLLYSIQSQAGFDLC